VASHAGQPAKASKTPPPTLRPWSKKSNKKSNKKSGGEGPVLESNDEPSSDAEASSKGQPAPEGSGGSSGGSTIVRDSKSAEQTGSTRLGGESPPKGTNVGALPGKCWTLAMAAHVLEYSRNKPVDGLRRDAELIFSEAVGKDAQGQLGDPIESVIRLLDRARLGVFVVFSSTEYHVCHPSNGARVQGYALVVQTGQGPMKHWEPLAYTRGQEFRLWVRSGPAPGGRTLPHLTL
jgi:hypothetical protein